MQLQAPAIDQPAETGLPLIDRASTSTFPEPSVQQVATVVEKKPRVPKVTVPVVPSLPSGDYRWAYWVFELILAGGLIGLSYLLWWLDGTFTISFINMLFPRFVEWGIFQWVVPTIFTAGVIAAWPRGELHRLRAELGARYTQTQSERDGAAYLRLHHEINFRWKIVTSITIVNMGTSLPGVIVWLRGDLMPQAASWIWYIQWPLVGVLALLCTVALAFGPEKLGRWAFPQFFNLLATACKWLWAQMGGKQRSTR